MKRLQTKKYTEMNEKKKKKRKRKLAKIFGFPPKLSCATARKNKFMNETPLRIFQRKFPLASKSANSRMSKLFYVSHTLVLKRTRMLR